MGTTTINGLPINQAVGTDGVKSNEIDVTEDKLLVDGTAVKAKALELNQVAAHAKVSWFSDFLGDALPDEVGGKAGSGTGNAVAASAGSGGRVSIKSASDDGAITANASALALEALDWTADQGGLTLEARLQIDDISEAYVFVGFTDVGPNTTLEAPVFLNAADLDSDATDACGVLYDVDGTTEQWCQGGVKNGTDTVPVYSGAAPTEGEYETIRVEVSATGGVRGFINGVPIGLEVANAVTATAPLCPVIVVANRSANAVTVLCDYMLVQADRA